MVEGMHKRGFSLLELQVALVILAVGLLAFAGVTALQGRQLSRLESWCQPSPTYYAVAHPNRWMRELGASAVLEGTAGVSGWSPPVAEAAAYDLALISLDRQFDRRTMSATVVLAPCPEQGRDTDGHDTGHRHGHNHGNDWWNRGGQGGQRWWDPGARDGSRVSRYEQ